MLKTLGTALLIAAIGGAAAGHGVHADPLQTRIAAGSVFLDGAPAGVLSTPAIPGVEVAEGKDKDCWTNRHRNLARCGNWVYRGESTRTNRKSNDGEINRLQRRLANTRDARKEAAAEAEAAAARAARLRDRLQEERQDNRRTTVREELQRNERIIDRLRNELREERREEPTVVVRRPFGYVQRTVPQHYHPFWAPVPRGHWHPYQGYGHSH
ncbi:MAG: hypothetical protein AAFV62_03550 [Pseudomonadota bacterium]